jgi:hypothetical protein
MLGNNYLICHCPEKTVVIPLALTQEGKRSEGSASKQIEIKSILSH